MRHTIFLLAVAVIWSSTARAQTKPDLSAQFAAFKIEVEPLFLKSRPLLNGPCYVCHSKITSRFRLESLKGSAAWSEAQSQRNFDTVLRLITPGEPAKSRLLLMPLATEAGGAAAHPGGKIWQSQDDPEWQALAAWVKTIPANAAPPPTTDALDFETFRTRVQPIFLDKKPGHARCYVCHSQGTPFRLQALSAKATTWNEEESRKNFEAVRRLVVPGQPTASRLLMMPLAQSAGGDPFHPGGKRWPSQQDSEWQMLAAWVRGK